MVSLGALIAVLDHGFFNSFCFVQISFSSFKWEWGLCILEMDIVNIYWCIKIC